MGLRQFLFDVVGGLLVKHFRNAIAAYQAFEHFRIHRQQRGGALGLRHIVLVHDRADEAE